MSKGTFQIKSWQEKPYKESADGFKMSAAHIMQQYEGVLQGESIVEYLMTYQIDGTAAFVGQEFFTGTIGERTGSIVFQHKGVFEDGAAKSDFQVLKGTGTEGLKGLEGSGSFYAEHGGTANYTFE